MPARARLALLAAAVGALHVAGLALLASGARGTALVGTAGVAYVLGLRHGFDADHIAAIDNATRRLRHDGGRPLAVGFFFAVGHAGVVVALMVAIVAVARSTPDITGSTAYVGATASGLFLWAIGLLNVAALVETLRTARAARGGDVAAAARLAQPTGALARLGLLRPLRLVTRSWQMLVVGALFGLGFETATEVALLALGAGGADAGLPTAGLLALPVLFAAAMGLVDTVDGVAMAHAYGWALERPARRVLVNIGITAISAAAALLVGSVQLLGVAREGLGLEGGAVAAAATVDLQVVGVALAALLVGGWLVALAAWRVLDLDARLAPVEDDAAR